MSHREFLKILNQVLHPLKAFERTFVNKRISRWWWFILSPFPEFAQSQHVNFVNEIRSRRRQSSAAFPSRVSLSSSSSASSTFKPTSGDKKCLCNNRRSCTSLQNVRIVSRRWLVIRMWCDQLIWNLEKSCDSEEGRSSAKSSAEEVRESGIKEAKGLRKKIGQATRYNVQ